MQNAIAVHLKGDLDLRLATWCWRDAAELESAEQMIVPGQRPLTLEDLDVHRRLVVLVCGKDLRLLGRDDGVARDDLGHNTANRLDAQGERRGFQDEDLLALATQDSSLDSSTEGHRLIRVHSSVRLLPIEEILDELLHFGDTSRTAHEHDLVNLILLQARVLQRLLHWAQGLLEKVAAQLLEASAGECFREVDAVIERLDLQTRLVPRAEGPLRLLHFPAELLHGTLVAGDVLPMLLLEELHEVLHDALVEVFSSKVCVP
mmetsp:Transcript_36699/g.86040  ORF Transcript_36699/g.86040 Transcript_36699/m.86040 type:complete len:261 (+) Transcript_36699:761-1543(+)